MGASVRIYLSDKNNYRKLFPFVLISLAFLMYGCPGWDPDKQVSAPEASPPGGIYTSGQSVVLSSATEGCTIYYTTDGSVPGPESLPYMGAIRLADDTCTGVTRTYTLRAVAVKDGCPDSGETTAEYTIRYPHLYVSGNLYYGSEVGNIPIYWKDGEVHQLPKADYDYAEVRVIALSPSGEVLAAGSAVYEYYRPVYWDADGIHELPILSTPGEASSLYLTPEGELLVAGVFASGGAVRAAYWSNGTLNILETGGYDDTFAGRIGRTGTGQIIVTGSGGVDTYPGTTSYACCWKDGAINTLSGSEFASGLWITETDDLYISGVGCYWKNGVKTTLSAGGADYYQTSAGITVQGGTVYVCGGRWYQSSSLESLPAYWKNGVMTSLPTGGKTYGNAIGIEVFGTDIYIVGEIWDDYYPTAVFWKNGTLNILPVDTAETGSIHYPFRSNYFLFGATGVLSLLPQ